LGTFSQVPPQSTATFPLPRNKNPKDLYASGLGNVSILHYRQIQPNHFLPPNISEEGNIGKPSTKTALIRLIEYYTFSQYPLLIKEECHRSNTRTGNIIIARHPVNNTSEPIMQKRGGWDSGVHGVGHFRVHQYVRNEHLSLLTRHCDEQGDKVSLEQPDGLKKGHYPAPESIWNIHGTGREFENDTRASITI
jgi:hypothetical protein